MSRKRRLEIEIASETKKPTAFKDVDDAADKTDAKLKKGLGDKSVFKPVEQAADKISSKLKDVGSKASDSFSGAMDSAGSMGAEALSGGFDVGSITDTITGSISGMGGPIGAALGAIGVAGGAAFAAGLTAGMEQEVVTDRLAAQLGGSEWAESMGEVAGNLYLDGFGESMADPANAVKKVIQNGLLPEDATNAQIEAMTEDLLTFTDVMEQDMDMATQAVSNMLRTGIADSGQEAFDILTRGVQQGADRAGDLLETFQEYSTMFRDIGISAEDATGLMVQGLQAGARDADTVADSLKEFAIRAQDGSDASKQGFKDIGLSASEMTAAVAEGGPKAREALDKVLDGLRNMEDPAARNAAAVALFGTKAEDLGDALFALDLDTAAAGMGTVEGATDKLGSAYDNASTKVEVFKRQSMQKLVEFVGNEVIPAFEKVRPVVEDLFTDIQGFVTDVVDTVEEHWPEIEAAITPVMESIQSIVQSTVDVVTTLWDNFGDNILAAVEEVWPSIQQRIQGTLDIITGIFELFSSLLKGDWQGVWDALGQIVSGAWNVIMGTINTAVAIVKAVLGAAWEVIKSAANAAWEWLHRNATNWWGNILDFIAGLPGKIAEKAAGMWDSLLAGAAGAVRQAQIWINRLIEAYNSIPVVGNVPLIPVAGRGSSSAASRNPDTRNQRGGLRQMAEGGIVRHRPGGIIANIGEGRYDEAVVPLKPGMGGLAPTIFNISFAGAIIASSADAQRWVSEALTKALANDPRAVTVRGAPLAT